MEETQTCGGGMGWVRRGLLGGWGCPPPKMNAV